MSCDFGYTKLYTGSSFFRWSTDTVHVRVHSNRTPGHPVKSRLYVGPDRYVQTYGLKTENHGVTRQNFDEKITGRAS